AVVTKGQLWAVGENGGTALIQRVDTEGARAVTTPKLPAEGSVLYSVAATSPNDVWAVGNQDDASGPSKTLIEHFNGKRWFVVSSPNGTNGYGELTAVAALSPNDVWAM